MWWHDAVDTPVLGGAVADAENPIHEFSYAEKSFMRIMVGCGIVILSAALGLVWLLFFSGRRLRMTDDYAAISSATLLALLLVAFVEIHLYMKRAASVLAEKRRMIEDLVQGPADLDPPRDVSGALELFRGHWSEAQWHVRTLNQATVLWLVTSTVLCSALILTCLWAAVDGHGPARWLAWTIWLSICWGFAVILLGAVVKALKDYREASMGEHQLQHVGWQLRRELWASKIARAVQDHGRLLSLQELEQATGLQPRQIQEAEEWVKEWPLRRRKPAREPDGSAGSDSGASG